MLGFDDGTSVKFIVILTIHQPPIRGDVAKSRSTGFRTAAPSPASAFGAPVPCVASASVANSNSFRSVSRHSGQTHSAFGANPWSNARAADAVDANSAAREVTPMITAAAAPVVVLLLPRHVLVTPFEVSTPRQQPQVSTIGQALTARLEVAQHEDALCARWELSVNHAGSRHGRFQLLRSGGHHLHVVPVRV